MQKLNYQNVILNDNHHGNLLNTIYLLSIFVQIYCHVIINIRSAMYMYITFEKSIHGPCIQVISNVKSAPHDTKQAPRYCNIYLYII